VDGRGALQVWRVAGNILKKQSYMFKCSPPAWDLDGEITHNLKKMTHCRMLPEELCNLFFSPNIIRVIKSRRIRWLGHVVHMGEMRNACIILVSA
jgi:hypothetical protein